MKRPLILLFIFILLFSVKLFANIDVRSIQLTTNNGIANNSVRNLFQDSRGFIWMGTLNGLSRYDGNSFVTFRPDKSKGISLADNRIKDLTEDKNGFLWISTTPELFSCYDLKKDCFVDFTGIGEYNQFYSHKVETSKGDIWLWQNGNGCRRITYKDGKFHSTSFKAELKNIDDNKIKYVQEDKSGNIWVGTSNSVFKLGDSRMEKVIEHHNAFQAIMYDNYMYFLSSNGEIYVKKDKEKSKVATTIYANPNDITVYGALTLKDDWVIFTSKGGFIFNFKDHKVRREARLDIKNGEVQTDNKGNYWVSNHTGQARYINKKSGKIKVFNLISADKVDYIDNERFHVVQDGRDIIWISTYGNGLFAYDIRNDNLQHFTSDINGFSHISNNFLLSIMVDKADGIWVGSEYTGISHLTVLNEGAKRVFPENENLTDRSNAVRMIAQVDENNIYVGTRRGGLYSYNADLSENKRKDFFKSNIYAVAKDKSGNIWLGSRLSGLFVNDKWYVNNPNDDSSLAHNSIFSICYDSKGRMWLGTFGGGLNLAVSTQKGYVFRRFFNNTYGQKQIRTIIEDNNGLIWIGTSDGVFVFKPEELLKNSQNYIVCNYSNGKLRNNEIRSIYQDSKGRIWIATAGSGVSMCSNPNDYKNLRFEHFDSTNGLINNVAQSFIEDKDGGIWIATEYGISRFDVEHNIFDNYLFSTSPLGNVYAENTALSLNGKLVFGTNNGMVVIDPQKVNKNNSRIPVVSFTNLLINGSIIHPLDEDSPLKKSLSYSDKIELNYMQNSFTIEFSTFDYSIDSSSKYSYKLQNYDTEWSQPSNLNFAAYKNIPPGNYTLKVKACNDRGVWSDKEYTMNIVINPPFWKTPWAFIIYILLIVGTGYFIFLIVRDFNTLRNKIAIEKQLTEYKLVFFTNISHEFRTPLTLIQGALEKMQKTNKIPKELTPSLKLMDKSTQRMLRLVNQLLEFRKMQNNKLSLHLEEIDIVSFLHDIYISFQETACSKDMDFRFDTSLHQYNMFIDKSSIEKVIYNLISNAFKYTPSGGKIIFSVMLDNDSKQLVMSVSDTGVGISKEKQSQLFSRFMQSNFTTNSMGIGLHLTNELVNVHHGTISFIENNEDNGGSVFTVKLPTDKSVYDEKDFRIPNTLMLEEEHTAISEIELADRDEEFNFTAPLNKRRILIIEDDNDVREFLKDEIKQYFEVAAESDGLAGYERAKVYDADLIVCDVMMPGMSGYEVTKKLKSDFSTSHIPIILLTALSSTENQVEGIECGADDYVTKPFSPKLLLTIIFKQIEQRDRLKEKFTQTPGGVRPVICTTDKDKEFADKLEVIIEQQYGNPQFTVDEFASLIGLGRTVFYRKVRGVTGYSPNEYIRVVRMKKAAELLTDEKYTVSEVSYKVGINDPFYFSKCFKQQFGLSPSAYQKGEGAEVQQ